MAQEKKEATIQIPANIVNLGRWAGVLAIVLGVVTGIWQLFAPEVGIGWPAPQKLLLFLKTLAQIGGLGVAIVLLAEIADRLRPAKS